VGIFRRGTKKKDAQDSADLTGTDGDTQYTAGPAGSDQHGRPDPSVSGPSDLANHDADRAAATAAGDALSRRLGPFDRSEVAALEGRLDLGALWLTGVPGMELRLEVEEESQNLVGVTAVLGESAVQLQAFAAPRTEGIWDDIRTEIAASITSSGGTADKTSGPWGNELQAQMPGQDLEGRTVFSPVRFVGVDGPRWFLRAVLSGAAATDQGAASALLDVVRSTVVVRGEEAMAPRELLPLKLPEQPDPADQETSGRDGTGGEMTDGTVAGGHPTEADAAPGAPSLHDLNPFERGPEITEIH
jgi:hypothetical protein